MDTWNRADQLWLDHAGIRFFEIGPLYTAEVEVECSDLG